MGRSRVSDLVNRAVSRQLGMTNAVSESDTSFDETHVLHELKHYLPTQTPLKDFIHHNTLHAFQSLTFYEAIFKASKIFGYQVTLELRDFRRLYNIGRVQKGILERIVVRRKGTEDTKKWMDNLLNKEYDETNLPRIGRLRAGWEANYKLDLDSRVQPLLFRILSNYLDQGISIWKFPVSGDGLLSSLRELEQKSFASFFKTKRAKSLLQNKAVSLRDLLTLIVGKEAYFTQYLFDQQFSHRGWSGTVSTIEDQPNSLYDNRSISLRDLIMVELLFEIDALDFHFGEKWEPLCNKVSSEPIDLLADVPPSELQEVLTLWQDAFEWSYYDQVLVGIVSRKEKKGNSEKTDTTESFQAVFCIDERECSLRRHLERVDPKCETLGTPGFFGVEFYFQPEHGKFYDKLCPAPVTPRHLIKEGNAHQKGKSELLYTPLAHALIPGFIISATVGIWAGVKLLLNIFRPRMSPAISNAYAHMDKDSTLHIENQGIGKEENGLQLGFTIEEMALRVEGVLKGIGLLRDFAPIIYLIAHGSSSANNPHHGAHDCGACSGRPGSVNARVFAWMANHVGVRSLLRERGLEIPDETQFIGCLHDTAADAIEYYDLAILSIANIERHQQNAVNFENALNHNAKERSRRFESINTKNDLHKVRKAIKQRSVSLFEPRPELGHGTNALCVVGSRNLTKNLFLDRRAFLNSYDHRTDPEGKLLTGIMRPLGPVCGGINLEYYFSRVDNHKLGAGTKLPHHVMGLIGVSNSYDGDLRLGLPLQMIEVHDPVRLLIIVEHFPDVVLNTIQSTDAMYEWYINNWVHLVVIHPETKKLHYFEEGTFTTYDPHANEIKGIADVHSLIESAKPMESNYIGDATLENLPVYSLN